MVHRVLCRHDDPSGGEQEPSRELRRKAKRRRVDAIVAIKERLLRCSEQGRRRFKRGYLLAGGDGRGDAADSAIFYLACLVCTGSRRAALLTSSNQG